MATITLPFWVIAFSISVPSLFLVGLLVYFLRKIRTPKNNEGAVSWMQQVGKDQFHNDLLYSQIDTIFDGLSAIVESERLKVQALVTSGNPHRVGAQSTAPQTIKAMDQPKPQPCNVETEPAESQIAVHAEAQDRMPEQVRLPSGLSQSEIDLAMKMRSRAENSPVRKLEAVA
jgi:hypothetical protein